ncbi:unnamed protein product [Ectocarpus fasciculatus]
MQVTPRSLSLVYLHPHPCLPPCPSQPNRKLLLTLPMSSSRKTRELELGGLLVVVRYESDLCILCEGYAAPLTRSICPVTSRRPLTACHPHLLCSE